MARTGFQEERDQMQMGDEYRAGERIADHTVIVGERLRYLMTGDSASLASEVR